MRFGYTTGSCAAAACKGAAEILLGGVMQKAVALMTPKGILLTLELKDIRIEGNQVTCAIQKDAMAKCFGFLPSNSSSTRGRPWVISSALATPPVWKVLMVS